MASIVLTGLGGCLLPSLVIGNLFFGWLFLKPLHWILLEIALVLALRLQTVWILRKMTQRMQNPSGKRPGRSGVIDVEGEVVEEPPKTSPEDKKRLK